MAQKFLIRSINLIRSDLLLLHSNMAVISRPGLSQGLLYKLCD